ncbi:MAG: Cys-tRNA(Pro) deacylase [Gammaproteobacteria bacterium]
MTPAITLLERDGCAYTLREYEHDPNAASYGLEAADKLGLDPKRVFKTLVVELDGRGLAVTIVPVSAQLNLKRAARALGAKRAAMAEPAAAERATGYIKGGISPLGQKKRLPTALDDSALGHETVFVSGGRRGLDLELAPADLVRLTDAVTAALV